MTIFELLAERRIRLRSTTDGNHRSTCPQCSHTRKQKHDHCLSVAIDNRGIRWKCWHCGWSGEAQRSGHGMGARGERLKPETLERLNVGAGMAFFPELGRNSECLFFQYGDGWKARAFPEKAFVSKPGTRPGFWNVDHVVAGPCETVYITEGELDAIALVEAGLPITACLAFQLARRNATTPIRSAVLAT